MILVPPFKDMIKEVLVMRGKTDFLTHSPANPKY